MSAVSPSPKGDNTSGIELHSITAKESDSTHSNNVPLGHLSAAAGHVTPQTNTKEAQANLRELGEKMPAQVKQKTDITEPFIKYFNANPFVQLLKYVLLKPQGAIDFKKNISMVIEATTNPMCGNAIKLCAVLNTQKFAIELEKRKHH